MRRWIGVGMMMVGTVFVGEAPGCWSPLALLGGLVVLTVWVSVAVRLIDFDS